MTDEEQKALYAHIMEGSGRPGQFSATLGMAFDRLDENGAEGHFLAVRELCNPFGIVHGGVYYAMMDQLAGMAACSTGRGAVTLDCSVNYLKSARLGDRVTCRVEPVRVGNTVAVYEGKCFGADGTLQCTGTFQLFLTKPLEDMEK